MEPSPAEIRAFLKRVRDAVDHGRVAVSQYAADRAADELEWNLWDILEQLKELLPTELRHCEVSTEPSADLIWVFTPELWDGDLLWIRLIERDGVVVISLHRA